MMLNRQYLLLPHLVVTEANAMSCAYATGFPAVTSFLGLGYALTYKIPNFHFYGMGIVVHRAEFKSVLPNGSFAQKLMLKKAPSVPDANGKAKAASMCMKGFVNLEVSLVIECDDCRSSEKEKLGKEILPELLPRMRLAGGDIHPIPFKRKEKKDDELAYQESRLPCFFSNTAKDYRSLIRRLMPGYALVSRTDLMNGQCGGDALNRLIYALSAKATPLPKKKDDEKVSYEYARHCEGWLLPLAVGFHDLSGNLPVANQREASYEHHFVEPLMTLCEFKMPYHFGSIRNLLWHYEYDETAHNYLCINE